MMLMARGCTRRVERKEKNQQQSAAGQGQQEKENYFSVFLWTALSGLLLPQLISLARESSLSFLFIFLADC